MAHVTWVESHLALTRLSHLRLNQTSKNKLIKIQKRKHSSRMRTTRFPISGGVGGEGRLDPPSFEGCKYHLSEFFKFLIQSDLTWFHSHLEENDLLRLGLRKFPKFLAKNPIR